MDPYDTLTIREREVWQRAASRRTNAEMASALFISRHTMETHRVNLMRKLNLQTQANMILYALRHGILPIEP